MKPIGDMTWKEYYSRELEENSKLVEDTILDWWLREDSIVENVLRSGGILSFPHTFLETSLEPVVRTVRSIYRCGMKKVIAFGVMHGVSGFDTNKEFSLDSFRSILKRTGNLVGEQQPELIELFLPARAKGEKNTLERIQEQIDDIRSMKENVSSETAIVVTGDLVHYGPFYGTKETMEDPGDLLKDIVIRGLDILYKEKDFEAFTKYAISNGNDQWASAIAASSMLKGELDCRIFSMGFSDYSTVFKVPPPCIVASVFYGAWPKII